MLSDVHWNIDVLATLYFKSIPNNIIVRANNAIYRNERDDEIREYIKSYREYNGDGINPYYLQFGSTKAFVDDNNSEYTYTIRVSDRLKVGIIESASTEAIIKRLINNMSQISLYRLIITPLKPICNRNVPHLADFTLSVGKSVYAIDHPFPRDIKLFSVDGIMRDAHSFVIASISPMICAAITNINMSPDNRVFHLGCNVELIDWFIKGAYESRFVFDEKIDHDDGLNLLSYLMIINKVVIVDELRNKLDIRL
jgi:hypothetical protein